LTPPIDVIAHLDWTNGARLASWTCTHRDLYGGATVEAVSSNPPPSAAVGIGDASAREQSSRIEEGWHRCGDLPGCAIASAAKFDMPFLRFEMSTRLIPHLEFGSFANCVEDESSAGNSC
jgi:hypothetical protein